MEMAGRGESINQGFDDDESSDGRLDVKDIVNDARDSSNDVEDPEMRWRPNSTTSSPRKYVPKHNDNDSDGMDMQEINIKPDDEGVSLQRSLGLWSGISIVAGTMIGSGIFVSPTGVISEVGSVGLSLIVWTGCGLLALLGSLCYAELGTVIPESGGEYAYFLRIYKGRENRHIGDIIAFLFTWVSVALLKPSSIAIISLVFAEYLSVPMFDACGPPPLVKKLLATCLLVVLTSINCFSVGAAVKVQNVFTGAKIIALLMIIIGGIIQVMAGTSSV